jgi:predicted adenine nucleotide alpha hydrolase (AANH) superfamily ATPase
MGDRLLLHVCCGPCATAVVERLIDEGWDVEGFYYNPNVHPEKEHVRRLESARLVFSAFDFPLREGRYDPMRWWKFAGGFEDEPEGGKRCDICFRVRLDETCREAASLGMPFVATTLSVSPHKNASTINNVGRLVAERHGVSYLERDFKKRDGFARSVRLSREQGLYRQSYCGCTPSMTGRATTTRTYR